MYSKSHIKWFFRYGLWNWFALYRMKNRFIRWPWQRLTRGFDDKELWSLDYTISKFILPRLKEFRRNPSGAPASFFPEPPHDEKYDEAGFKAWHDTLDKMILAFELDIRNGDGDILEDKEYEQLQEGMNLFAKYYLSLWD